MKGIIHSTINKRGLWLTLVLVVCISGMVAASKGGGGKEKKGYVLKFNGFEVKKSFVTPFSLMQQGATYKGTISPVQVPGNPGATHSIITLQKGNTIFICPLPQKNFLQKFKTPSR